MGESFKFCLDLLNLTSMSRVSSFDFDWETNSRRESDYRYIYTYMMLSIFIKSRFSGCESKG